MHVRRALGERSRADELLAAAHDAAYRLPAGFAGFRARLEVERPGRWRGHRRVAATGARAVGDGLATRISELTDHQLLT